MEAAFAAAGVPLLRLEPDGTIEAVNGPYEQMVGACRADLVGRSISDTWDVDLLDPRDRLLERLRAGEQLMVETSPVDPLGGLAPVSMRFVPISPTDRTGFLIGVWVLTLDERKRKVDLSSGSIGFQLSFEQLSVPMIITRVDGTTQVNEALCAISGRTREEIAAIDIITLFHPDDRAMDYVYGTRAFAGEIDSWTREKRLVRADDVVVWISETVSLIRDAEGAPLHFITQVIDIDDRKRAEAERDRAEARAALLTDGTPVGLVQTDGTGSITSANTQLADMLGFDPLGLNVVDIMHPADIERADVARMASRDRTDEWSLEFDVSAHDGSTLWVRAHSRCQYGPDGELVSVTAAWINVTDEVDARRASERFAELLESVDDLIAIVGPDGSVVHLNRAGRERLSRQPSEVGLLDLLEPADAVRVRDEGLRIALAEGKWTGEVRLVGGPGDTPVVSLSVVAHRDARGQVECYSAITRDISELKDAQELLRTQAATDVLTGLPNRADFSDRLGRALARTLRTGDAIAVLFVDLDRFKGINDRWGHSAGDELLVQVGQRLTGAIRTGDTVARVGGDEFVVLAEPVHQPADAQIMGERIVRTIAEPFELQAGTVSIGASVGLAMNTPHSTSRSIVHAADLASMHAKATGRSRLVLAGPEVDVVPTEVPW
jgi:diguanylate cyclase (GGDEF)-like protein/PAS domain S-box-containing protein